MATKVLIVDDEQRNRRLLEIVLSAEGYVPLWAGTGAEALALVAREHPAALLLDLMMPDMDGFELIRRLRAEPGGAALPVLVVSALDDAAVRQRALAFGVGDFVLKPVDRFELLNRLRRLLAPALSTDLNDQALSGHADQA